MNQAFNLLDENWIMVRKGDKLHEISLKQAFSQAHEFDALAGELPTQDVAILRLMLAAMYGAISGQLDPRQNPISTWNALWEKGRFEDDFVNHYLESWRERFWLFHPTAPFFQVAGLTTKGKTEKDVSQMIADVPSRAERRFFSNLSGESLQSLNFAQAARWLVHLQAWDYAGKKASVTGGSADGGGTGWCGKLGIVYAKGENLFETLMYNFILSNGNEVIPIGKPAWEQPVKTAAKEEILPSSYVELLTWQSRRALLTTNDAQVTGVVASYGDVFPKENQFSMEQMSGWHLSSKKGQGYIPTTLDASRSLWRDLNALLPQKVSTEEDHRPGVVKWITNELDLQHIIHLCAVGYEYGAMMGVVNTMINDTLNVNATLLGALGEEWAQRLSALLADTESAVRALGNLANDLVLAAGCRDAKAANNAQEQAYFVLDEPFRNWLQEIDPSITEEDEAIEGWNKIAAAMIKSLGHDLISSSGEQAFVGREFKDRKGKTYRLNAAIAQRKFEYAVKKYLGW